MELLLLGRNRKLEQRVLGGVELANGTTEGREDIMYMELMVMDHLIGRQIVQNFLRTRPSVSKSMTNPH